MKKSFRNKKLKRLLAVLLMFLLLPTDGLTAGASLASATLVEANGAQSGMVRVYLSSLNNPSTLTITVQGSYTVNGLSSQALTSGSSVTVNFNSSTGKLTLVKNGISTSMGSTFKLRRHQTDGTSGVKIAQAKSPNNLYPADVSFVVKSSGTGYKLYVILNVYIEDYLYGVLPYEMGNSAPLEALKAQAVTARTYTLRAMDTRSSSIYDVVDTTGDQVYRGTPSGYANCKAAVDATKGIVSMVNGDFTGTWYTASNGGQIEAVSNIWGSSAYSYIRVKDDPYDLANPDSRVKSFTVNASGTQSNSTLGTLLNSKAVSTFGTGATVAGVTNIVLHTPKYAEPSRLYTKIDFYVTYRRSGSISSGVLTFSIFDELESPLSMSLNSSTNELWSVTKTDTGFLVEARRYGHGTGMSQRGAMYMAQLGYTYAQILAFYFEGCERVRYTLTNTILSPVVSGKESYEVTTEETPAELEGEDEIKEETETIQATVTTVSGSLNLRAGASTTSKILKQIPKGTVISVLEKGDEWCCVTYNGMTGYVMMKYLTFMEAENTATPTPSPMPAQTPAMDADATYMYAAADGTAFYRQPRTSSTILAILSKGDAVTVLEKTDEWVYAQSGSIKGYVRMDDVTRTVSVDAEKELNIDPNGPLTAKITTKTGSALSLRKHALSNSKVLKKLVFGTVVTVLEKGVNWCLIEHEDTQGYVQTKYLTVLGGDEAQAEAKTVSDDEQQQNDNLDNKTIAVENIAEANGAEATEAPVEQTEVPSMVTEEPMQTEKIVEDTPAPMIEEVTEAVEATEQPQVTDIHEEAIEIVEAEEKPQMAEIPEETPSLIIEEVPVSIEAEDEPQATDIPAEIPEEIPEIIVEEEPVAVEVVVEEIDIEEDNAKNSANDKRDKTLKTLDTPVIVTFETSSGKLNLRAGCSKKSDVLMKIKADDEVLLLSVGQDWCEVEINGQKKGFVMTRYLVLPNEITF